ncbi:hypothetical protein Hdeb2414_s0001g00011831 [Helianthus debilis subsp. tardiflorus]
MTMMMMALLFMLGPFMGLMLCVFVVVLLFVRLCFRLVLGFWWYCLFDWWGCLFWVSIKMATTSSGRPAWLTKMMIHSFEILECFVSTSAMMLFSHLAWQPRLQPWLKSKHNSSISATMSFCHWARQHRLQSCLKSEPHSFALYGLFLCISNCDYDVYYSYDSWVYVCGLVCCKHWLPNHYVFVTLFVHYMGIKATM